MKITKTMAVLGLALFGCAAPQVPSTRDPYKVEAVNGLTLPEMRGESREESVQYGVIENLVWSAALASAKARASEMTPANVPDPPERRTIFDPVMGGYSRQMSSARTARRPDPYTLRNSARGVAAVAGRVFVANPTTRTCVELATIRGKFELDRVAIAKVVKFGNSDTEKARCELVRLLKESGSLLSQGIKTCKGDVSAQNEIRAMQDNLVKACNALGLCK